MRQQGGEPSLNQAIATLASRAQGVVTRQELLGAGLSSEQIRRRIERGTLIAVHRGVYRVGHRAPSREARYMAAVKACGGRAVLCGRAAAHVWGLIKGAHPQPEVLAPSKRVVPGVLTHRSLTIARADVAFWQGIPLTSVPRTLVDIASSLPDYLLGRACHEADVRHSVTPDHVEEVLARRPSTPGARTLRRIIHGDEPISLSRLESRFVQRLRDAGLALPQTNRSAGGRRVDCRWPDRSLTVELDGFRYHRTRHAWDQDRLRERQARVRGDEFRRFTYRDVFEDPAFMLAELRSLL
jgi:Transcriptional regulator, AbiEi antitoxin